MKIKNSCTMLREERDLALFEAFRTAMQTHEFKTQKEAINFVRLGPAPKWFTSPERAAAEISRIIRGRKPFVRGKSRMKKYFDLWQEYKKVIADEDNDLCHFAICEKIVETPAPQWYLGYKQAFDIIAREIEANHERMSKRYARGL